MRTKTPLLLAFLALSSLTLADRTSVNVSWSDQGNVVKSVDNNSDFPLAIGNVLQVGYFAGVDPNQDPATYTPADWASFVALSGEGSLNPTIPDSFVGAGFGAPAGFFGLTITFNTEVHSGLPDAPVRIGIRFYDADTVAGSTFYNTVSASGPDWILPIATDAVPPPIPAEASMDVADLAGTLAWEGTPFQTDLVPGVVVADLVLTDVTRLNATTLQISWTGGDGSNDIRTSITGTGFATVATGRTSPATITIDPVTIKALLVQVIEP